MLPLQKRKECNSISKVHLVQTKQFRVYDCCNYSLRTSSDYTIEGYSNDKDGRFLRSMNQHGLTIWKGLVSDEMKNKALKVLKPFIDRLLSCYDETDDEFCDIDQEEMNIIRMPRIGRGKHNIHFDPEFSEQHKVLEKLANESHLSEVLSQYMKAPCSIRESGMSMTRPYNNKIQHKLQPRSSGYASSIPPTAGNNGVERNRVVAEYGDQEEVKEEVEEDLAAGEGMEWHSDGPRGESTVLMALEDVEPEQGCLRVIPGSHRLYVDGIGHTEVYLKGKAVELQNEMISYAYRAGQPMIIDARTLHSVAPNTSNKWRVMVWYIFDSF
mmetsp:Transcript_77302/g.151677  ORF Transcript_77302/g.151677 Transcript_77302/m.151677 type:complete len:326 (+) Transcript_77302:45-1022(+)